MAPVTIVQGLAAIFLLGGFIALIALRVTPISWFPWDVVVTAVLLLVGVGLALMRKRIWPKYEPP